MSEPSEAFEALEQPFEQGVAGGPHGAITEYHRGGDPSLPTEKSNPCSRLAVENPGVGKRSKPLGRADSMMWLLETFAHRNPSEKERVSRRARVLSRVSGGEVGHR